MADKKKNSKGLAQTPNGKVKHTWVGFANCRLSPEHIVDLSQWEFTRTMAIQRLTDWTRTGYKIAITPDDQGTSYSVSMTDRDVGSSSYGYTLSAFAEDWVTALKVLAYKHETIMPDGWVLDQVSRPAMG